MDTTKVVDRHEKNGGNWGKGYQAETKEEFISRISLAEDQLLSGEEEFIIEAE